MRFSMKRTFWGLFLLFLIFPSSEAAAGKTSNHLHDGYFLYIPSHMQHGRKVPVLIALPGNGISPKDDVRLWRPTAEREGFFVVDLDMNYDMLKNDADIRKLHERIRQTLEDLSGRYIFDAPELYIAGTSAGAVSALALSLRFPETYHYSGLVSGGTMYFDSEEYLKNASNLKYMVIHGEDDPSIDVGKIYTTKKILEDNGAKVVLKIIPNGKHALPRSAYRDVVLWFHSIYESPQRKFFRFLRGGF